MISPRTLTYFLLDIVDQEKMSAKELKDFLSTYSTYVKVDQIVRDLEIETGVKCEEGV